MTKITFFTATVFLFLLLTINQRTMAQQQFGHYSQEHYVDAGVGIGLDYGGIVGVKMAYITPFTRLSVFGAAGLQILGFGWNVGTTFRILSMKHDRVFRPNIKIMYGINRSTVVIDASEYNAMFTGWTPGVGAEFRFGKKKASGFDVDLNFPIGSVEYQDQVNKMESDPYIESIIVLPVAFSIGFHRMF